MSRVYEPWPGAFDPLVGMEGGLCPDCEGWGDRLVCSTGATCQAYKDGDCSDPSCLVTCATCGGTGDTPDTPLPAAIAPVDTPESVMALASDLSPDEGCPFCGHEPFEYVDVGVGGRGVPVAVTCCPLGIDLFRYGDEFTKKIADRQKGAAAMLRRYAALLATPPQTPAPSAVRVKALGWPERDEEDIHEAETAFGKYVIGFGVRPGYRSLSLGGTFINYVKGRVDDAKAAAQVDYDARILACLEVTP